LIRVDSAEGRNTAFDLGLQEVCFTDRNDK
jgi:hypothetical protein